MTGQGRNKKILDLLEMQISLAEQELGWRQARQLDFRQKAKAVLSAARQRAPAFYDIAALQAAEHWQELARQKARQFQAEADNLQPGIDQAKEGLRELMRKKVNMLRLFQATEKQRQKRVEQADNEKLLDLERLRSKRR